MVKLNCYDYSHYSHSNNNNNFIVIVDVGSRDGTPTALITQALT